MSKNGKWPSYTTWECWSHCSFSKQWQSYCGIQQRSTNVRSMSCWKTWHTQSWMRSTLLDDITKQLTPHGFVPPRWHGLPKTYKNRVFLKPIISTIGDPIIQICQTSGRPAEIQSGKISAPCEKVRELHPLDTPQVKLSDILISFDVVSFFAKVLLWNFKDSCLMMTSSCFTMSWHSYFSVSMDSSRNKQMKSQRKRHIIVTSAVGPYNKDLHPPLMLHFNTVIQHTMAPWILLVCSGLIPILHSDWQILLFSGLILYNYLFMVLRIVPEIGGSRLLWNFG